MKKLKNKEQVKNKEQKQIPKKIKKIKFWETGLGHIAIQNNLNKMQEINIIKRIASRKNGYWEVLK